MNIEDVVNRYEYDFVSSNLVYPISSNEDRKYFYICKVDKDWVHQRIRRNSVVSPLSKDICIANKYAIKIQTYAGNDILIYNHDGHYWMIDKAEKK